MAIRRIRPASWEYLHDASDPSLQSFELSRLNHAANLRREIAALLDQWIEDTSQAMLARWVRQERAAPPPQPDAEALAVAGEIPEAAALGEIIAERPRGQLAALPHMALPIAEFPPAPEPLRRTAQRSR